MLFFNSFSSPLISWLYLLNRQNLPFQRNIKFKHQLTSDLISDM